MLRPRPRSSRSMRSIARLALVGAVVCASPFLLVRHLRAEDDRRLIDAVQHHDVAQTRALLDQRVEVNARDVDGATALHWAVYWDDTDLAIKLLTLGAKAN